LESQNQASRISCDKEESKSKGEVLVPYSRAAAEREILLDIMAMRDESSLCRIDPEERKMFTDEAIGKLLQLDTQEIVTQAAAIRPTASFSQGVGCGGTPNFSQGITCKIILRR
jgi:hypothetical protein